MSEYLTTVYLPSKGKLNPENEAYAGPIEIDMMGTKEEKMIFGSSSNDGISRMLQSIIKTEGIKVDDMVEQDRMFLLVKERIHTYGDIYHIKSKCPDCGATHEYTISLDDIEVKELPDDMTDTVTGILPLSKVEVTIKSLKTSDRNKINRYIKAKVEKLHQSESDLRYDLQREKAIVSINGEAPKVGEAHKLLNSLKAKDVAYLDYLRNKYDFGYQDSVTVECKSCGKMFDADFEMTSEFFRPRFD